MEDNCLFLSGAVLLPVPGLAVCVIDRLCLLIGGNILEKRLADMAVLIKNVSTYQKTKPVYDRCV